LNHKLTLIIFFGVYKKENSLTVLLDIAKVLDIKDLEAISSTKKAA
jgi:purine-binding chemotaxis protein CheW